MVNGLKLLAITGFVIITNCSCGKRAVQDHISATSVDKKEEHIQNEASTDIYSLNQERALEKALNLAQQNINSPNFIETFETKIKGFANISTSIEIGHLFSSEQRHIIIRRKSEMDVFLNIYSISKEKPMLALFYEQGGLEYVSDTIQDVNGDQQPDFLINWYGSIGCCLKNFYDVYLLEKNANKFSKGYEFINPTFSAKEKMVRGVGYGHPGATYLYKFHWDGFNIDTLEYIFPDEKRKGQYLKSATEPYDADDVQEIRLKSVPIEYKGIYGYDWFLGKIN
ncbi:MAG: hypothetical protein SFV55_24150 [Haliscomenobacter sp.]|uniref:hypothetical protein n=1 Tax=Haliscomenobacter sp. TaxID=2717303 RepID=UPI0029B94DC2|nr:hypothetical protein [Haliscomenobacter sp.]MDX2071544.1 hypothetical protein [Haliscomenobacter sp.]